MEMLAIRLAATMALCVLLAAPAYAERRSCAKRGSDTIAANAKARIYAVHEPSREYVYYGCLHRRPRPVYLAMEYMSGGGGIGLGLFFQLRGRLAGFAQVHQGPNDGDGVYEVAAMDLRTRRKLRAHSDYGFVHDLALTSRGSLAFVTSRSRRPAAGVAPRGGYNVWRAGSEGAAIVDAGEEIDPASLAVGGGWMYWVHGAAPRSAPIE